MPSKNTLKRYRENGIYHVYNRANNHQNLFDCKSDYLFFLSAISSRLLESSDLLEKRRSFYKKIRIFAYCLMPTHYHFLLEQKGKDDMAQFMKSLQLSYSLYRKRTRALRGRLYESRYKARLIESTRDFLNVSRYIHRNPIELGKDPYSYLYSSLRVYANSRVRKSRRFHFLETAFLLKEFGSFSDYKEFLS